MAALTAKKVAIFGASRTPGKMGYVLVEQLLEHGYQGEIALVNPAGGMSQGLPLLDPSAAVGADVAVIAVPPAQVGDVVRRCGDLRIPVAVVLSAGFAETRSTSAQADLRAAADDTGVLIMGPNCLGFFEASSRLNLTTLPDLPRGTVSLVSQSGGLTSQVGRRLKQLHEGFQTIITLGNKLDVTIGDCLDVLIATESGPTLLYLESFDEGEALLERVALLRSQSPVVVMLGGRSAAGRDAARSHTASMFGSWTRIAALLQDAGALVCDRLETAIAASLGGSHLTAGRRVFVLCDGGGHSVLLGDACDAAALSLPVPSPSLSTTIGHALSSTHNDQLPNPLDLAGAADVDPTVYTRVIDAVEASDEYDACIVGGIFGGYTDLFGDTLSGAEVATAHHLARLSAETRPVVVQTTYAVEATAALDVLRQAGTPVLEWPSEAAAWLAARSPADPPPRRVADASANVDPTLGTSLDRIRDVVARLGLLDGIGPVMNRAEAARLMHGPTWVLRLDDIVHKARAGAVHVDVPHDQVPRVFDDLEELAAQLGLTPRIRVGEFIPHDHELLLTVWSDRTNGTGVALGGGGRDVEASRDVAIARRPRTPADVDLLLRRTVAGSATIEGLPTSSIDALTNAVIELANALDHDLHDFQEIEFNPLAIGPFGVAVLDAVPTPRDLK